MSASFFVAVINIYDEVKLVYDSQNLTIFSFKCIFLGYGQEGHGQDPYASSQSGYQPDYSQQGGGYEGGGYNQYGQGEPTSFSNEM